MTISKVPGAEEQGAEIQRLLEAAQERYKKMSPEEQASMWAQQAISYVIGELTLGVFDREPTSQTERAKSALESLERVEKILDGKNSNPADYLLISRASQLLPKARFELKTSIAGARRQINEVLTPSAQS